MSSPLAARALRASHRPLAPWAMLPLLLGGCAPDVPAVDPEAHRMEVERWRAERRESLLEPDGWLSLVGLYWLAEGEQAFGSGPDATLAYRAPGVPPRLGTFTVRGDTVDFRAEVGVEVRAEGGAVATARLRPAPDGEAPVLRWGPLRWHVIGRDGRLAVRLKSAEGPALVGFRGIESFPVRTGWRIDGRFEAHDPPKTLQIPNILGTVNATPSPGAAVFEIEGRTYRLDLWRDSDDPANYFTAFADATNGRDTYGGGRFLWIDAPGPDGRIVVDFNKAYNPPCVFTEFATCPLPPPDNRLDEAVEAGEKTYGAEDKRGSNALRTASTSVPGR